MHAQRFFQVIGAAEAHYIQAASRALIAARLNRQYPDGRATASHIAAMGSAMHGGLYPGVEIDVRSGLPSFRQWVQVRTDHQLLAQRPWEGLSPAELEKRAAQDPTSVFGKQLLQFRYREQLLKSKQVEFDHLDVQLMRVDAHERTAQFRVIMDKLSSDGILSRTSIELVQKNSIWTRSDLQLSGEYTSHTESFRTLIYSMSHVGAEMLLHRLHDDEQIQVQSVIRGTVGPFYIGKVSLPPSMQSLATADDTLICCFGLDVASAEQLEDRDNDPFSPARLLAKDSAQNLPPGTGPVLPQDILENARKRLGYRVFRDRKFVTNNSLVGPLTALCSDSGTRNIIYGI